MADVSGKFFSAVKVRTGVSPSSPGVEVGETLPPVNPPGGGLNSVGLTMPSAFAVANSPLTSNGTIAVTGAGTVAQYVRGDGTLADFPESSGGGSSVSYYLNGSVSQGTIGGVAYLEMNKVPILGAGTDFTRNSNGYIASFITDAGDPNLLEIPGGNWNFESYFSASSGGGSPTFYVELYKVNAGGTATLIASNSANPELISFGTTIAPYFSSLAVPTTVLALTDRLAVRYYVTPGGRTLTLHTEGPHLCQIITTFTTGLTALNGLTTQVQFFAVGTSGTDFNIASATATHTFNLPTASATNRGALSSADWALFTQAYNDKINSASVTGTTTKTLTLTQQDGGTITASWTDLNTDAVISVFGRTGAVVAANGDYTTAQVTESGNLYYTDGRARGALSFAAGSGAYNTSTGVITIPTNNNQITNGAGYITSAGTITGASGALTSRDNRTISPSEDNAGQLKFGFTSWANNDGDPYADYLHLRSYTDSSGGNDNLVMFLKSGIGMRIYQQSFGSATAYSSFKDIAFTDGTNASGTWGINITGNAGTVTNGVYTSRTITINGTTQDLSANRTFNVGTVTSVTASSPLASSGGATPNITIQQASSSQNGFLSSTDWTTFNNKQNALTNPITGTGTTNYLPKFTGSTTIGNSTVTDNGSNVEITTSDLNNLFVTNPTTTGATTGSGIGFKAFNGSSVAQYAGIILTSNTWSFGTYSAQQFSIGTEGTGGIAIRSSNSANISFFTGGAFAGVSTEKLRIFSDGNVFIGSSPSNAGFKLDVNGTGRFSGALTVSGTSTLTGRVQAIEIGVTRNGADTIGDGPWYRWTNAAQDRQMLTQLNASNGLTTWAYNGSTWTSVYTLTQSGAATFSSSVTASGSGSFMQADFFQTGSTPATSGGIRLGTQVAIRARNVANTANIPLIESTATDAISIASGGANVGIGTTSPTARLGISANAGVDVINVAGYAVLKWDSGDILTFGGYKSGQWNSLVFSTTGSPRLTIASTGAATFSSSVTATSFFESSDATLKTLVQDDYQAKGIESVVAKLYIKNGKQELGYFAQDLQGILPSAVNKGTDGLLNLSYREVHTAKIASLENRIKELELQLKNN
jgi:hypothetical protein